MKKIIEYTHFPFMIQLRVENQQVRALSKETKALLFNNRVVVCGGIPLAKRFNSRQEEQDLSYFNTNVLCLTLEGELVWRIGQGTNNRPQADRKYLFSPYLSVDLCGGDLRALNMDGWLYKINPDDGSVSPLCQAGK